jgi:hypothetical protein
MVLADEAHGRAVLAGLTLLSADLVGIARGALVSVATRAAALRAAERRRLAFAVDAALARGASAARVSEAAAHGVGGSELAGVAVATAQTGVLGARLDAIAETSAAVLGDAGLASLAQAASGPARVLGQAIAAGVRIDAAAGAVVGTAIREGLVAGSLPAGVAGGARDARLAEEPAR